MKSSLEKNFLSRRLLNGSLKIMNGEKGGGFYVRYKFYANSGMGNIELIIEYPDGMVVAIPLCKNVCREVKTEGNVIGKWAKPYPEIFEYWKLTGKTEPAKHHAAGKGGGSKNDYESFIKYERPDFKIPIEIIWRQICSLWEEIPIRTQHEAVVLEDVYFALLDYGNEKAEENEVFQDEKSVFLKKSEIEEIVNDMGYNFNDIRRLFDNRDLWIKDKGSQGYQFSKKIDGKKQHFYRLKKVSDDDISINTEHCMEYPQK